MKITRVDVDGKLLKVEVDGETHTILNLISTKLLEYENVEIAGYDIPHPLQERGKLIVRVKEGSPVEQLIKGIDELISEFKDLKNALEQLR